MVHHYLLLGEVRLEPRSIATDEVSGRHVDQFSGPVDIACGGLYLAVLDHRAGSLRSCEPAAKGAVDDAGVAQRLACPLGRLPVLLASASGRASPRPRRVQLDDKEDYDG